MTTATATRMRRLHLFEFGDLPWFPRILHHAETAFLSALYRFMPGLRRQWTDKIAAVLDPKTGPLIVDLATGSGGAMPEILDELASRGYNARAILTDLRPIKSAPHPGIICFEEPVDATHVPPGLTGVRTMFSAFHHFRPETAKAILKDAFDKRCPICIFEVGAGGWIGVCVMVLIPFFALGLIPLVRPFHWSYAVFTYLIPLIPLFLFLDGIVSNIRIYSPGQLKELTSDLTAPDYGWEIGRLRVRGVPGGVPYLIGFRRR